jgi:hypothetical protein
MQMKEVSFQRYEKKDEIDIILKFKNAKYQSKTSFYMILTLANSLALIF